MKDGLQDSSSPDSGAGSGPDVPGGGKRGFSSRAKLIALFVVPAALMMAAALILPTGAIRLLVMAVLGMPAIFLLMSRPRYILAIVLFFLFSNLDIFLHTSMFRPLVLLMIVCVVTAWLDGRPMAIKDRTMLIMMAVFYLIAFQSMAFAQDIHRAATKLESLAGVYVVVFVALLLIDTEKRFLFFLAVLVVATLISNFLPFAVPPPDYYATKSLMWNEGVLRYEGYRLEPNFFAFYQIFIIPVLLFFFAKFARPRLARPIILASIIGTVFVLMLSFSRGGFVSLLVIIVSLLIVERGNRTLAIVSLVAIALLTILAPALYWDRITSLFEAMKHVSEDYAIVVRIMTMKAAVILGIRNPLFGVGIDNFLYEAARFIPYTKDVHNFLLQVFSELGFPGLAVIVAIFVRNFRILHRMIRKGSGNEETRIGMFLMVQQIAVGVNAMFIPSAYDFMLWLTLAMPSIAQRVYSDTADEPVLR